MAAQFVAPFRKSRTAKNDRNDAEAIATAARQGNMRLVPVKTVDQQVRLSRHRVREGYKTEALATSNRLRGLLAEFGVVVPQRDAALRRTLAGLDALSLPSSLVELLRQVDTHWQQLQAHIADADRRIQAHAKADEACTRLRAIIGIGPITADAVVATIGSAQSFANGRQFAAWLGLVPMQHSSGGRTRLAPSAAAVTVTCEPCSSRAPAAACSGPRPWRGRRPRLSNAGSRTWSEGCRSARCWWPSPTSTRASCGRCWRAANTTMPMRG